MKRVRLVTLGLVGVLAAQSLAALPDNERVGPFRWARKLYDPAVPVAGQLDRISRDNDVEQASLAAGSTHAYGVVDVFQWTGSTLKDNARNWSANTLLGDPGKGYAVSLEGWEIEEGAPDADGNYVYYPKAQQDAYVRFGFLAAKGEDIDLKHGQTRGLDSTMPCNAIMVALPFRRVSGGGGAWQTGYYSGNPAQAGIWQVPAGLSLHQAQMNTANRLCGPGFLAGTNPDTKMSLKLQIQVGGAWQLLVDLGCDGTVDRIVNDAEVGNLKATVSGVTEDSGLMITTAFSGGIGWPKVGHAPMEIGYIEDATVYAIDCGSRAGYLAKNGTWYQKDAFFAGGSRNATINPVAGTEDDPLYQTWRDAKSFSYALPIDNGRYGVKMQFAEAEVRKVGKRVFDVAIEGAPAIADLDLCAVAGLGVAYDVECEADVKDGVLDLAFVGDVRKAVVSAIVVYRLADEDRMGPFRWARKLFSPDLEPDAQLHAIAASGDIEDAVLMAGSSFGAGSIGTTQWKGIAKDAVKRVSANTFVGDPCKRYFISVDSWGIENAYPDTNGVYNFYPLAQQDAYVRFGYWATNGTDMVVKHGMGFVGYDEYLPVNAIVVALPFRRVAGNGPAWQMGYYTGNPTQAGVWQIPEGLSLHQAQMNTANRLCGPGFLAGTTPDTAISFKLELMGGGAWRLLVDRDKDGTIDQTVSSSDSGNQAATVSGVTEDSGLIISTAYSGASRVTPPEVVRAEIGLGYKAD